MKISDCRFDEAAEKEKEANGMKIPEEISIREKRLKETEGAKKDCDNSIKNLIFDLYS